MQLTLSHTQGPAEPPLRDITLGQLLAWAAETTPDRLALIAGVPDPAARRQWTYAELYRDAERTARALRARFEPGERVAVWAPNLPEWVLLEFGCALAGVVLVTVNPAFRAHELEYVLKQSRSAGIFVVESFRGNPMRATVQQVAPNCAELRHVIRFDQWQDFLAGGDAPGIALPAVKSTDPVRSSTPRAPPASPRARCCTTAGLSNNGAHTAHRMGVRDGDVWVTPMPLFHTGGCVCCVLGALSVRATNVLVEAFDPGLVLELIETDRATPARRADDAGRDAGPPRASPAPTCRSVHGICSGGSTVPAALVRRIEDNVGRAVHHRVRPDRVLAGGDNDRPDDSVEDKAGTIGTPLPHVEVKIVDPVTGQTLPVGQVGEICARGYQRHARLLREARRHRRRDRRRRLAAHRRPVRDGRARLLHGRRPAEGHDHPRRREHLPARDRGTALPPPQRRRGRGGRPARCQVGRAGGGLPARQAGPAHRQGACSPPTCASTWRRTRRRATGSCSMPSRSPARARSRSSSCASSGRQGELAEI